MRAGKSRQLGLGGGMCPSKHPTLGEQGGTSAPDPCPQEPQPWVGTGQGPLGGQGADAGGGQPTAPRAGWVVSWLTC